ncbi:MAG: hypothetical protein WAQ98_31860 [Blastocatellia bacterium]
MNQSELGLFFESRWFFYTPLFFTVWLINKGLSSWLERKESFNNCRVMKDGKGLFAARPELTSAFAVGSLGCLVAALVQASLLVLAVNPNVFELIDMVLLNVGPVSFLVTLLYLAYQSHLMEIRQNARFLLLDTLFHNNLHTFRFNGKNLQGAMRDLLKAEMVAPYGASFSNTGIVYQLTEKGRNAYQEHLDAEAENERLILPTSHITSRKQIN